MQPNNTQFQWLDAPHQFTYGQPQQKPKGNFLTSLIPTGTGTAGALGGAAIGTAILPGFGTLVGALLGGAAGGGAGKVAENAVEGNPLGNGVAGQAIEQGILGAGPLRLLKGAGAGAKALADAGANTAENAAVNGATRLTGALDAAGNAASAPGFIAKAGKNLTTQGEQALGRVSGTSAGSKWAGDQLTPQDTASMLDTLSRNKIKIGNANNMTRDIQDKLNEIGKGIDQHFTENNTPLDASQTKTLASDFLNSINTTDPRVLKEAKILADDLQKNVTDTKSLWQWRQSLDNRIPDSKMASGNEVLSNQMKAIKDMRQFIAGRLDQAPGMNDYHQLSTIQHYGLNEANRANNSSGGLFGRLAQSGPVQYAEAKAGKAMQVAGKTMSKSGDAGNPWNAGAITARTVPIGTLQAALGNAQANNAMSANTPSTPMTGTSDLNSMTSNTAAMANNTMPTLSQNDAQMSSPFDPANIENNIAKILANGGTTKDVTDYVGLVSTINNLKSASSTANKPMSATSAEALGNVEAGMQALQDYQNAIQKNPSALQHSMLPGRSLFGGYVGKALGTSELDAARNQIVDIIGRLRSGAAISNGEWQRFNTFLPQPGDTPQAAAQKMAYLQNEFQNIAARVNGNSTPSTNDLASALGLSQ